MSKPKLYLMLGYPGAGKTTAAGIISKLTGAVHLASDQVRLELFPQPSFSETEHQKLYQVLNERTKEFLSQGRSVVYDANLNRYQHRQEKYEIAKQSGAQPILVWLQVDKKLAKQRATHELRNHLVPAEENPAEMFERIVSIFEPPDKNETAMILNGTSLSDDYVKEKLDLWR